MKKRLRKWMMFIGTAGMLSMAVYGCGGTEEEPKVRQEGNSGEDVETEPEEEEKAEASDPEAPDESAGDTEGEENSAEQAELCGDVHEIGEGKFVVNETTVMEGEGDSEIMIVGAPGNEEDMNLITVSYDENTRFYKRTIWNGGADYEDTDASPEDIEKNMTAEMLGSYEGDVFHASEVKLVEVIL